MVNTLEQVFSQIEAEKGSLEFMRTGFKAVDELLDGGFLKKELIVVGAFTGTGKSYLAGQLMTSIASQGFRSAYFSLEIGNKMIVSRMLGAISNIKPTRIQTGLLSQEEFEIKSKAKAQLLSISDYLFFYDDIYELDVLKKEIKDKKYDFVIVDFLQNIVSKGENENIRLNTICIELQRLAKEVDCTILALSQLSNIAAREGSGSKTIEFRGSGAIAMVSDLAFFMERNMEDQNANVNSLTLSLKKNRRGSSGVQFTLFFTVPGGNLYEA